MTQERLNITVTEVAKPRPITPGRAHTIAWRYPFFSSPIPIRERISLERRSKDKGAAGTQPNRTKEANKETRRIGAEGSNVREEQLKEYRPNYLATQAGKAAGEADAFSNLIRQNYCRAPRLIVDDVGMGSAATRSSSARPLELIVPRNTGQPLRHSGQAAPCLRLTLEDSYSVLVLEASVYRPSSGMASWAVSMVSKVNLNPSTP